MQNKFISLFIALLFLTSVFSQRTVGLLSYKPWISYDGYNLIYPHNQPHVYLLDNCGEIVHKWENEANRRPGNTAYITEEGNLVFTTRSSAIMSDPIWAGGGGEKIEIRSWDNEIIWEYSLNTETERLHHDIALIPNGNILAIAWELKTNQEAIDAGRNPDLLSQTNLWPDKIIEINPETDEIVWEWKAWDHLVQDFDATKANFGIISESIGKINVNYDTSDGASDWLHGNALDYDPVNDHVLFSVPTFDEMWVIDHSTTKEEAATNSGGFSGKGGNLIYRWGNPAAYNQGTAADKKLNYQHDLQIVDDFLPPSHPLYGKYAVFNNRFGSDFSTFTIWDNTYDMYDAKFAKIGEVYAPENYKINKTHPIPQKLYSTGLSSVQVLPNSNYLVTDGRHGYSFELTPDDEIVWEYVTPLKGGAQVEQGLMLEINDNLTFRMKRFPINFKGFEGKDLSAKGFIELNGEEIFCDNILPIEMFYENDLLQVYPNPANQFITIEWESKRYEDIQILDIFGRELKKETASGGKIFLDVSDYKSGYYFVRTSRGAISRFMIVTN